MSEFVLRWGICCAGRVSNEFALALNIFPKNQHQIVAIATRDETRSKEFAAVHSVSRAYGSYKELASDPNVDVVYIGAVVPQHYKLCKLMLESKKHVLCEKPLGINANEAKELWEIAKSSNKFFMEAIWTRCFPAYAKLREILNSGLIGEVTHVQAQLGMDFGPLDANSESKQRRRSTVFSLGDNPFQLAQMIYGEKPTQHNSFGTLLKNTGIDTDCYTFLRYSGDRTALLSSSLIKNMPNEGFIFGTNGNIKICSPTYAPIKLEVNCKNTKPITYDFPLPTKPDYKDFVIPHGEGYTYEAEEVRKCIMEGNTQSSLVTSKMSIELAEMRDTALHQISYGLHTDKVDT